VRRKERLRGLNSGGPRGDQRGRGGHQWSGSVWMWGLSSLSVYRVEPLRVFDVRSRMLNAMAIDPIQLTKQLVDIESTTYCEGPAGIFLHEYLLAQRYAVERTPVSQPDRASTPGAGDGERFNVYAALPGVTPDVVLSTHMDTVPPFFGCTEDDEFLYGRGTCDAKGIIAAQVAAADRLRDAGVKVGLLFVVGEERDSAGAALANESPKGSRFLINGEPTDNRLALASKGALRVELRAKGRMAHSAYPELGESAIDKLIEALHDLLAMDLPVEPEIGPSTLNIGLIEGGRAPNVIADKAEAHILVRLVGPSDEIKRSIVKTVGDRADVDFSLDLPFVRMRKVGDLPTMVAKFTTDIPKLTNWGEPFLLGPGSIHVAHTPKEKIAKKELLDAVGLYVDLATSLVANG
jgi:acetylornithine deacetylase